MKYSYSRVECYEQCPFKYDLRYVKRFKTLPTDDASSPLIIGTAMHEGIEKDVKTAIDNYFMSYPVITDAHIIESIKLEAMIPKVKKLISEVCHGTLSFEYKLDCKTFIGYIDLLEEVAPGYFIIYDFKYSNNESHYLDSRQLHVYKYYFELITGFKVLALKFIMIPKIAIKQKKTETEFDFKVRLKSELAKANPYIVNVNYNIQKVIEHKELIENIENNYKTDKKVNGLCNRFCEFYNYCRTNGEIDFEIIYPKEK